MSLELLRQLKMEKPNWDSAPYWANYLAMDESGRWMWYEGYPEFDRAEGRWNCDHGRLEEAFAPRVDPLHTLEERPEEQ